MCRLVFFSIVLSFFYTTLQAQSQRVIDSLLQIANQDLPNVQRVNTYLNIAREYKNSDSTNIVKYANKAFVLSDELHFTEGKVDALIIIARLNSATKNYLEAEQVFNRALEVAKNENFPIGEAKVLNILGSLFRKQRKYDVALEYYYNSIVKKEQLGDKKNIANIYNSIGGIYKIQGKYDKSLDAYTKSLNIREELGNKIGIAQSYNNMGIVYQILGNYAKTLDYFFKSLKIKEDVGDKSGLSKSYNNIGLIYQRQSEYEKALSYFKQSLEIKKELVDKKGLANSYNNIGIIYSNQQDYEKSLNYYFKSIKVKKELEDEKGLAITYNNIAIVFIEQQKPKKALEYGLTSLKYYEKVGAEAKKTYPLITIGESYELQKNWKLAKDHLNKALTISKEMGIVVNIKNASEILSRVEKELGNYKAAYENQIIFKQMEDSLQNETLTKNIARLEAEYEFQKEKDSIQFANEKERIALEKDIETGNVVQRATFISLILLALLLSISFLFLRLKTRSNKLLMLTSNDLKLSNEELKALNGQLQHTQQEVKLQRDILKKVNNKLNIQNRRVKDSLLVAKSIQKALFTYEKNMECLFEDFFVLNRPKDVVSGDFYWVEKIDDKILLVVADCTGHGVPAALMTMISRILLDKIIKLWNITTPNKILEALHQEIYNALSQDETGDHHGMDAAIVCIEKQENKEANLVFSGARNSIYYSVPSQQKVEIIAGSRKGIGGWQDSNKTFVNHEITLENGSFIYLGSDGMEAQCNNEKIRLGKIGIETKLNEIHELKANEQLIRLEKHLSNYTIQRDDILWVGVKI